MVVLGGTGFVGSRVLAVLRAQGIDAAAAGRHAEVRLDLCDPTSVSALDGARVVIDCADALAAPPDAAIRRVVAAGGTFVEASAVTPVLARLLDAAPDTGPGAVVLGAGVFPGLSNQLAAHVAGGAEALAVGVRMSPLSGCGPGTSATLVELLDAPATWFEAGSRREGPAVSSGPVLPFAGGARGTLRLALAEPLLLRRSTAVPTIEAFLAPSPALGRAFALLYARLPSFLRTGALVRWLSMLGLRVLRSGLLRWRPGPVELVAVGRGPEGEQVEWLHTADGMEACAHAIAAVTAEVLERPPGPGVWTVEQVLDLPRCLARLRAQGLPGLSASVVAQGERRQEETGEPASR